MNTLTALSIKAAQLKGIGEILGWDQETYMPPGAAQARADQLKLLAGWHHEVKTSPEFKRALSQLVNIDTGKILVPSLSEEEKSAVREWRRDYLKESKLPASFIEEFSMLTSAAIEAWKEARLANDFAHFKPYLEKIVQMSRKQAEYLGYKEHPYDALLDLFEPGLTTKAIQPIFDQVQKTIAPLLKGYKSKKVVFHKKMSIAKQLELARELLTNVGYDFNYGRLDLSIHPFSSTPHPTDSRITTRIRVDDPLSNLLTTLHEVGHAFYDMGLPAEKWGTPAGESVSMAVHESQSRFWETRIGLSLPFWKFMAPKFEAKAETLYHFVNHVKAGFIRVDADEVTYPLHIILRYRLEKGLIEGSIRVQDIPVLWNEQMKSMLGITPPDDKRGCLQDIHWSMGSFGYFPTYLLGTLYASHLFEKFSKDHPDWEKRVESGDLQFIKTWLHQKIHRHGRTYPPLELMERATGKPFSPKAFLNYIKKKYAGTDTKGQLSTK